MKNTIKRIFTGIVERFKPRSGGMVGGYATVIIPELNDRQLAASDKCGPLFIEPGDLEPVFRTDRRLGKPFVSDEVVLEVTGVNGDMKVTAWGYAKFWRKAEEEISYRTQYRVVRENRFKGQVMSGNAHNEVVFRGTLQQLVESHPRDGLRESFKDPFAPIYRTGPCTAKNHFEVKEHGRDWEACDDPRPFPAGRIYRVMFWQNGESRQLGIGTALELDWKFPRGKGDPLEIYTTTGEAEGYLYWERRDAITESLYEASETWTEVADPRPVPVAVKPVVAMPKMDKPRQKIVRSLADLTLV